MMSLRKPFLLLAALLAALALGACGDSHTKVTDGTYAGESGKNAPYLDVGPLVYQVQLSRQLNPTNSEDSGYLQGVPYSEGRLLPGEEWFGVFIQVYNYTDHSHKAAEVISISDTEGNVYKPVAVLSTNHYVYRAGTVPAKNLLPNPDTTAQFGPTQGQLLLFKIKTASLDNRPLEVKITNPEKATEAAKAELDV
jgi:hypothetical protein